LSLQNVAEKHMATYEEGVARDFIDVFIEGIKKEKDPTFNLEQLIVVCMDLFLGGTDTTSNALSFTFLYLAVYPEVQQKLRDELERISPGREPALSDSPE
jgi:cytochrome P450 family 2 subfamily J